MVQSSQKIPKLPQSRLQRLLTDRILSLLHEDGLQVGGRINENSLALRLNVSRSPVRASLDHLAELGVVARKRHRGVQLIGTLPLVAAREDMPVDEDISIRIARDRENGLLREEPSETELMQRYDLSRTAVQRTLQHMSELGLVERKPGHGWRFLLTTSDKALRAESYRFRMIIEAGGLLEPQFGADPAWIAKMRQQHLETIEAEWHETSSVAFFEMNASFHEGIAEASGNRFILAALQHQNKLRRFVNYNWEYGFDRVVTSCREHIEILKRIADGENEIAAALMRRHLECAQRLILDHA